MWACTYYYYLVFWFSWKLLEPNKKAHFCKISFGKRWEKYLIWIMLWSNLAALCCLLAAHRGTISFSLKPLDNCGSSRYWWDVIRVRSYLSLMSLMASHNMTLRCTAHNMVAHSHNDGCMVTFFEFNCQLSQRHVMW